MRRQPEPGEMTEVRAATLVDRITAQLPSLTEAERRAARALLAGYPGTGLDTVGLFAERAGVSAPTVLRFIAKLGFTGYAEFRRALREELEASEAFPLTRPHAADSGTEGLAALGERLAGLIRATVAMTPRAEVDRLVDLLCDERRAVLVLGGHFTEPAARHLAFHLRKLRPRVRFVAADALLRADEMVDLRRGDVFVAFDVRRYQRDTVASVRFAKGRGCKTVLFTDQWMSEAAKADLAFRAQIDGPSRWDSLVAMIAQVELVAQAFDERVWSNARLRVEAIERARAALADAAAGAADPDGSGDPRPRAWPVPHVPD
jgi:DNA-binding MurR/RpiR family transcriptional regulator